MSDENLSLVNCWNPEGQRTANPVPPARLPTVNVTRACPPTFRGKCHPGREGRDKVALAN